MRAALPGAVLALLALAGCTRGGLDAGTVFRDCPDCPDLVVIPPGRFRMGAEGGEATTDGGTGFGPETAFTDSTSSADAAPRESIELRTLVFHRN